ncbi:helix-turn-helix domain-containing protein [Haladaptatus sp. CMAA 1911]|uniref:helix-turn-helix domain-containing protein n=1 Tax=unclassified Haladaptatus TaxID=2622732 RepID=UPI0037540916
MTLLNDGTVVMMYQLRGDLERAKELLDASPVAINCGIAGKNRGLVYVHSDAVNPGKSLLLVPHEYKVILDTPLEYTTEGNLRVTLIGESRPLKRALAVLSNSFDVRLEETGEYHPGTTDLISLLTDRQREILRIAIELGYYETPRQASLRDIANEVELSVATVGEHLQKVEAKILRRVGG